MGFFKNRKGDGGTIDLSDMQRRGILKKKTPTASVGTTSQGYADLTGSSTTNNNDNFSNDTMSFFDSIATSSTGSTNSGGGRYGSGGVDVGMLNKRVEDLEYKMENYMKKLNQLLDRMEVAEKRLDRIEGRGPY